MCYILTHNRLYGPEKIFLQADFQKQDYFFWPGDNPLAQSNKVEKNSPRILKDDFSSRKGPSIFTSVAPELLERSKKTSRVFPAMKSISHSLPHSTVSPKSESSSEANFSYCQKSDA